ncbi:MAG: endonuclease/exonuclease/phosphatase family protein [Bacteroidales bacterium]|nr:endonuclease/exonuclease/phosphatase family protein [Bacteroidales bacterium]
MARRNSRRRRRGRSWFSSLSFGTVALVLTVLLVLGYLSIVVPPEKAWFFTLFGLIYPLVLPATLVLFVIALVRRSRTRLVLALALVPSLFFAGRYFQISAPKDPAEPTLSVVSYNVGLFRHGPDGTDRLKLASDVAAYINTLDADIVCLQEFYLPENISIDSWLRRQFPGYKAEYYMLTGRDWRAGNVTLTRRQASDRGKEDFEKSTNMALWADIPLGSSTLRVYNCHFESYNISLPGIIKKDVEETERKLRRSITERPRQVAKVLKGIDGAPVHSIVAGDFNDTPLSYTYFRLIRGRKDSFMRAGKGFGATYSALWPLLRLDYILYPKDLEAVSYRIDKVNYSDHYPVIVQFNESGRNTE